MKSNKWISATIIFVLLVVILLTYSSYNDLDNKIVPVEVIQLTPTAVIDETCVNYPNQNLAGIVSSDWIDGEPDAPIAAIEYGDFQCPGCAKLAKIMSQLKPVYGKKLVRVYRHFPTATHKYGMITAEAAEAAGEQGQFWPYHDLLFSNQSEWENGVNKEAVRLFLVDYAQRLAISDTVPFVNDLDRFQGRVEAHYLSAVYAGVTGNPALFVNGVLYPVRQRPLTLQNVRDFIDRVAINKGVCLGSL